MVDEEQQQVRADLISRLFALLSGKFEDGAALAAECQGARSSRGTRQWGRSAARHCPRGSIIGEAIVKLVLSSGGVAHKPELSGT